MSDDYSSIEKIRKLWQNLLREKEEYKNECFKDLILKCEMFITLAKWKRSAGEDELHFLLGEINWNDVLYAITDYIAKFQNKKEIKFFIVELGDYKMPFSQNLESFKEFILEKLKPCRYAMLIKDCITNYNSVDDFFSPKSGYTNKEMDDFLVYLSSQKEYDIASVRSMAKELLELLKEKLKEICKEYAFELKEKIEKSDYTINARSIGWEEMKLLKKNMERIVGALDNEEDLKEVLHDKELLNLLCIISDTYSKYCEDVLCTLDDIYEVFYTFS